MRKLVLCAIMAFVFAACSQTEYSVFSTLHGVVSDYETGNPVSGVNVVLSPSGATKITGNDGYFEFQEITPQQYTVTVQKSGYATNRKSVTAISGENTEVNISIIEHK